MKSKILIFLTLIASFFGYLEWGSTNHEFIFETEFHLLSNLFSNPKGVLHPFIILPFFGQLLLLIALFQKQPKRILVLIGIVGMGILYLFLFVVGLMSFKFNILMGATPFVIMGIITIRYFYKK